MSDQDEMQAIAIKLEDDGEWSCRWVGISPEMAQTLVTLGARLPAVETHIDLQEGIEQIERILGYRESAPVDAIDET